MIEEKKEYQKEDKIKENQLRQIVTTILLSLEKQGYLKEPATEIIISKKQAYVLCEMNHEKEFLEFLRSQKDSELSDRIVLTAILESPSDALIDTLLQEQLCQTIAGKDINQTSDMALSIYPSVERSSLCAAGLGMDNTFTSMWLRKDMEMGRKSVILVGGLEPFTGLEPQCYQELILSYIKNLMRMDVRFANKTEDIVDVLDEIEK